MPASKPFAIIASADPNYAGALAAAMSAQFNVQVVDSLGQEGTRDVVERIGPSVLVHDAGTCFTPEAVRSVAASVATLVLGPDDANPMIEAVEAGALGYLSRDSSFKEIEQGAISAAQGTATIPPFMLGSLLRHVVERHRREAGSLEQLDGLTPREREVFLAAAIGLGHEGVAERLFISPATARTHLHRIFKKLDIHSKAELVALAASCGLATSEDL